MENRRGGELIRAREDEHVKSSTIMLKPLT